MTHLEKIKDVYAMMSQGQMLEAFEKYYHPDVVMMEATGEVRKGKEANREYEKNWLEGIQEMHGGGNEAFTTDEENGITMVETWVDVTLKNGYRMKMEEIARQKWEGDYIIEERFYYNMPK